MSHCDTDVDVTWCWRDVDVMLTGHPDVPGSVLWPPGRWDQLWRLRGHPAGTPLPLPAVLWHGPVCQLLCRWVTCVPTAMLVSDLYTNCYADDWPVCQPLCRWVTCIPTAMPVSDLCANCYAGKWPVCQLLCQWMTCVPTAMAVSDLCANCYASEWPVCQLLCQWVTCVPTAMPVSDVCANCYAGEWPVCQLLWQWVTCVPTAMPAIDICANCYAGEWPMCQCYVNQWPCIYYYASEFLFHHRCQPLRMDDVPVDCLWHVSITSLISLIWCLLQCLSDVCSCYFTVNAPFFSNVSAAFRSLPQIATTRWQHSSASA